MTHGAGITAASPSYSRIIRKRKRGVAPKTRSLRASRSNPSTANAPSRDSPADASRIRGKACGADSSDLRALAFGALSNTPHSLDSACKIFGVKQGKGHAAEHGRITDDYIAYNRRDVSASLGLLNALRVELEHHPILLDPCKAYSPASIAKAHLDALGIAPPSVQFRDMPPRFHGYAMSAYYGGRAEVRIRNTAVPVVYTDFLSMYPTVNTLMGLWSVLIADRVDIQDATAEVREMLAGITLDRCFDPVYWRELLFIAEIRPNADVLPIRARYSKESDAFNIGVNPVTSNMSLWYAGPDVVASALLTGRPPEIVRAFRIVPRGQQQSLASLNLGGRIPIDPRTDEFFRTVIEARKTLHRNPQLSPDDARRLDPFLKVVANSMQLRHIRGNQCRMSAQTEIQIQSPCGFSAFAVRRTFARVSRKNSGSIASR